MVGNGVQVGVKVGVFVNVGVLVFVGSGVKVGRKVAVMVGEAVCEAVEIKMEGCNVVSTSLIFGLVQLEKMITRQIAITKVIGPF
jgi:hypothetical protein